MPTDLLIFDLDGTLVDTRRDLAESVNYARNRSGFPDLAIEQIMQSVGDGLRNLMRRSLPDATDTRLDTAINFFKQHYGEHLLDHSQFYKGVEEVLNHFAGTKKIALVSNKPEAFTKAIVTGLGFSDIFSVILGGDSLETMKPSAEPLLHVAQKLGITPASAIMIGDSPSDIIAGRSAGMQTCAVTYGYRSKALLAVEDPDYLTDRCNDLIDLIK